VKDEEGDTETPASDDAPADETTTPPVDLEKKPARAGK